MIPVIIYSTNSGSAALGNEYLKVAVRNDNVFYLYVLLQVISYFLVIIGTRIHLFVGIRKKRKNIDTNLNIQGNTQRGYFRWGCLFWMVGFFAFLMIMRRVGGIYYFFTHLQFRRSLTSNIDFWSWLLPFINYGCLLIVYSLKGSSKKMGLPLIGLLVVSGLISGLGGRKALIILLLEAILIYHYTVKKIELKKFIHLKYILGVILLYVFFILMSNFRTQGAFETFLSEPISFIKQSNGGIFDTLRKESYVPFFIAVLYYFKSHDFWFGRSFLGLITAPIPSSLYAGKPPVDDGAYLYSICSGRTEITPPMPYSSLDGSSEPSHQPKTHARPSQSSGSVTDKTKVIGDTKPYYPSDNSRYRSNIAENNTDESDPKDKSELSDSDYTVDLSDVRSEISREIQDIYNEESKD